MGGADQGADVAGILDPIQHEQGPAALRGNLRHRPLARLDDRQDALRRFGRRQGGEGACGGVLDQHRAAREIRPQRGAPGRAIDLRRDERAAEREPRAERLFDEADAFDERQASATARFAALEIADGRLQITRYGSLPQMGRL